MEEANTQEALIRAIRQRTENYYAVHGLCCSEAIIVVLNRGLRGGLSDDMARCLGVGFCGGMGGGEGVCGALSGGIVALGVLLGPGQGQGLSKAKTRQAAKKLHDAFREALASTCCRDLTVGCAGDSRAKLKNCLDITGLGAELCTRIILEYSPKLAERSDFDFLNRRDTKGKVVSEKIRACFCSVGRKLLGSGSS